MPSDNVRLVLDGYAAANSGGDLTFEGWHAEVVIDDPSRPDPTQPDGLWRGHDGARRNFADWEESFSETEIAVEEIDEAGDGVIARVRTTARGRSSGVEIQNVRFHGFSFRDGAIARLAVREDRAAALQAIEAEP